MLRSTIILAYAAGLASIAAVVAFLAELPFFKGVNAGDPGPIGPSIAANFMLIGLFGLHHSVTARRWFKARWTRLILPALERATYLWTSAAAVALLILFWQPVPVTLWQVSDPWAAGAVWAAFIAVWGLMFSATFPIGHFRFFGHRSRPGPRLLGPDLNMDRGRKPRRVTAVLLQQVIAPDRRGIAQDPRGPLRDGSWAADRSRSG